MKKLLSVLLALVMVAAVGASSMVAMAADAVVGSIQDAPKPPSDPVGEVNGSPSTDVHWEKDPTNPNKITFTYDGDGDLTGWEFPGMREGIDYKIIAQQGNSITIELLNGYNGQVSANAIVDFGDDEEDEAEKKPAKKNKKTTSPNTGAVSAAGLGVAGAGVALLAAMKKRDAE